MKKRLSFVKTLNISLWVFWCILIIQLLVFMFDSSRIMTDNASRAMGHAAMLDLKELSGSMAVVSSAVKATASRSADLESLSSQSELSRMIASQNLLTEMQNHSYTNTDAALLFVYNPKTDTFLSRGLASTSGYGLRLDIENAIRNMEEPEVFGSWFYQDASEGLLIQCYKSMDNMVGGVIPLGKWISSVTLDNDWEFILTQNGQILQSFGRALTDLNEKNLPSDLLPHWILHRRFLIAARELDSFRLYVIRDRSSVLGGFGSPQLILILLLLTAMVFLLSLHWFTKKQILEPTGNLLGVMEKVGGGEYESRLEENAPNTEFETIGENMNRMLDTIVGLKLQAYEDRIRFDEATLKFVQLQIRPHFFLNALTTIHSMSYQNRNEDIRKFIDSLSLNVRYLFKSGLHTVPLREEADHVQNYIQMQEMLYPGSVFSYINIAEETRSCQVPQLIIHTMVENTYKHAVAVGKLTCILINARMEEKDGENMCHIQVEDDGDGYPQEFLEAMRAGEVKVREDGHGVGLWNLTHTLEIMYQRKDLIAFSNKEPHGSCVDIWIPRRAKRQSSVWKL